MTTMFLSDMTRNESQRIVMSFSGVYFLVLNSRFEIRVQENIVAIQFKTVFVVDHDFLDTL